MSFLKSKKLSFSALGIVFVALAAAQGCSSSDDTQANPTGGTSSGGTSSGGHAGTASGGTSSGGHSGSGTAGSSTAGSNSAGTSSGGASGAPDIGAGGEGGAVDCSGPDGCYNCAPSTTTQFLNHCVEGGCQPAQNFHLPATLPALP